MTGSVTVVISDAESQISPSGLRLEYEVRNDSSMPVWLVDDGWLIWRLTTAGIELSYGRGKMQPGAQVFGYFPPAVVQIAPGQRASRTVQLLWPQRLDRVWNPEALAAPTPGHYPVSVRVGYGLSPAPDEPRAGETVEAPVLRWQQEAVSPSLQVEVPPY